MQIQLEAESNTFIILFSNGFREQTILKNIPIVVTLDNINLDRQPE